MSRANATPTVTEIMTRRVRTGAPEYSLDEIWKILAEERCHHIPILDEDRLVGMISTSDLVALARTNGAKRLENGFLEGMTAADIMTREVETIQGDESVDEAINRIGPGVFHALVVLDEGYTVVGIVTHHDLLHYLAT